MPDHVGNLQPKQLLLLQASMLVDLVNAAGWAWTHQ